MRFPERFQPNLQKNPKPPTKIIKCSGILNRLKIACQDALCEKMERKKLYHFSYLLLCLIIWQNSVFAQIQAQTSEVIPAENLDTETDLIHTGDLIDVDVIGSLEYDWRGTLNKEGFLDGLDLVENPIFALCRSETELAEEITKAYSKNLREPRVIVKILDRSNRPLSIINGAVKTPQRFQIKRPVFLNELIVISGGLTENASGDIQIYRPPNLNCRQKIVDKNASTVNVGENQEQYVAASQDNGSSFINIRLSELLTGIKTANPQILSGDIVTIQQAEFIYVIGGVTNPKQISSRAEITLSRAIASAGGTTKNADTRKVTIYRREDGATRIIEADLEKIKAKQAEDITLKAFDIVEVDQTGRAKNKFAPIIRMGDSSEKKSVDFPLRIID